MWSLQIEGKSYYNQFYPTTRKYKMETKYVLTKSNYRDYLLLYMSFQLSMWFISHLRSLNIKTYPKTMQAT